MNMTEALTKKVAQMMLLKIMLIADLKNIEFQRGVHLIHIQTYD